jgi:hypothetical protein
MRGERLMKRHSRVKRDSRGDDCNPIARRGSQGLAAAHGKLRVIIARGAHSPMSNYGTEPPCQIMALTTLTTNASIPQAARQDLIHQHVRCFDSSSQVSAQRLVEN